MLPAKTMLRLSDVGNKIPNDEQNTYEEILRVSPHAQVEAFYQNKLDMENPIKLQDLAEYIEENSQQEGTFKQKFVVSTIPHTCWLNTLRPRRNEQHSADDIFKHIFFNENVWISTAISLKFVPKGPINNISALVQIMAWRRSGDKPYLYQWWLVYRRIYASLGLNEYHMVSSLQMDYYNKSHGYNVPFWIYCITIILLMLRLKWQH